MVIRDEAAIADLRQRLEKEAFLRKKALDGRSFHFVG